ncbi:MAG: hypothetical protein H6657_00015 [Ardenticatenaceae bacterium]|nr:hypothetical protein [Ardenticatenaceae bacterium]
MSQKVLDHYYQVEVDKVALSVTLNQWSQVLIAQMIGEQEQKLVASDQPVDTNNGLDQFWADAEEEGDSI